MGQSPRLAQAPPYAFDRVGLRLVLRQVVQLDAVTPGGQALANHLTVVIAGVVADRVDSLKAAKPPAEVVQSIQEE